MMSRVPVSGRRATLDQNTLALETMRIRYEEEFQNRMFFSFSSLIISLSNQIAFCEVHTHSQCDVIFLLCL
jgi:hypothetical protein